MTSNGQSQRAAYPSDLTDQQWSRIDDLLPADKPTGRPRSVSLREVVNAINYRWHTGCVWRMLPHDYPHWATIYTYFRDWQRCGVLREIRTVLLQRRTSQRDSTGRNAASHFPPETNPFVGPVAPRGCREGCLATLDSSPRVNREDAASVDRNAALRHPAESRLFD